MNGTVALAQAKKYTDKSLQGVGAIKGAPCTIKSATEVNGGTEIVFEWKGKDGTSEITSIFVKNGVSITNIEINKSNHLICTLSDNTIVDAGEIKGASTWGELSDKPFNNIGTGLYTENGSLKTNAEENVQSDWEQVDTTADDYINNKPEFTELTKVDIESMLGLNQEELEYLATVINDSTVQLDKTYSSSKIYTELQNVFDKSKVYTLSEVAKASGASYKVVTDTAEMTDVKYIYLLANGDTYDMYIYEEDTQIATKIGNTNIDLTNVYTKTEVDNFFVLKSAFILLENGVGNVSDLNTTAKTIVSAINEVDSGIDTHISNNDIHVTTDDKAKIHTHTNKTVLDNITQSDIDKWNSGSAGTSGKSAYEIAVDNGFKGTEEEWLESLKGEKGNDGRSITSITTDENNNVIVTFSDNTTQNIGQLNIDVQADFLTSDGFGKLRYYNSHFQYYDDATSTWVDTSVTPDNVYIMNMIPQPMKKIMGVYDTEIGKYKLKWEEPSDTIIDGQVACIVEKVIIRRKLGSAPVDETDGDLVVEVKRSEFGQYKDYFYVDYALSANIDDVYYYKAFPVSTTGFYNTSSLNETIGIKCKDYNLYGFKIDQNESDPASMITYLSDCDNAQFASAYMDYTANTFNYGDWGDVWFIKKLKPCMLKYDGTVDYELDKNDYTKKDDGTDSDIANTAYEGNAMVGIPKVYWKIVDNGDNTANVYFCDKKIDNDFVCWSHVDNNGNEIDYCYMPIYCGSVVNNALRSLSGRTYQGNISGDTGITYATANNQTEDIIWYIEVFSDRVLINILLLLIGKSTDSQTIFGTGNTQTSSTVIGMGTMNTKGLFWGSNNTTSGVKVFGMENWWGNQWRKTAGCVVDNGTQKVKMTYGQLDGSTTNGYNPTGEGYISISGSTADETSGGFISKMLFTPYGLIPIKATGSATTYYTDELWFTTTSISYLMCGGRAGQTYTSGALAIDLSDPFSYYSDTACVAISCKPLASIT